MKHWLFAITCGLALVGTLFSSPGFAQYTFRDINPSGFTTSQANGIDGNVIVGYGIGTPTGGNAHALAWNTSTGAYKDINVGFGLTASIAYGVSGGQIAGQARGTFQAGSEARASYWSSPDSAFTNLNGQLIHSWATGVFGVTIVGYGSGQETNFGTHAFAWNTSSLGRKDLNGSLGGSQANGISGVTVVGVGSVQTAAGFKAHAVVWDANSGGVSDLHPGGYDNSYGYSVSSTQAAGYAALTTASGQNHAGVWNLATGAFTDLHPAGFTYSEAYGVANGVVVGHGVTGASDHALAWNTVTGQLIDLHQFIPSGYTYSVAQGIDTNGNIAGYVFTAAGDIHACVWLTSTTNPTLATIRVTPGSIMSGTTSTGTVTLSGPAPSGGALVSLASDSAAASLPASVTIPAGGTRVSFTINAGSVASSTVVSLTAGYGGLTRLTRLIITPAVPADTVAIQTAEYKRSTRAANATLSVQATSTNASATLKVHVTSTGALIGTLTNLGGGRYSGKIQWPSNPQNITVKSGFGGLASKTVTLK